MYRPAASNNWIKCHLGADGTGHYAGDSVRVCQDMDKLRRSGNAMMRKLEAMGIPVNRKKCKLTPLTRPVKFCKGKFTWWESGRVTVNGCRDGGKRARRKLKLFRREWLAGKRTLEEVAQYMPSQLAYYRNYNDHGRLLRLWRLGYALFGGKIACTKSKTRVVAQTSA